MSIVIESLNTHIAEAGLRFRDKPILIGGMAMEYYGMRKSGADIDLVIRDEDYQVLARGHAEKRKDLWGDLGVVIGKFEIWRSIALLDYEFYGKDAIDEGVAYMVSLERLLFMRVIAMEVEKYRNDLRLMKEYYCKTFTNPAFLRDAESHKETYQKNNGVVWAGNYTD